jgi:TRAP-type C4-dicarboxylate transport system permease small subunit
MSANHESMFVRTVERVGDVLLYAATIAGVALTAFVALSAFMRYFVGEPFSFTEPLVGLLFCAMVFLSLPYCTVRRRHIEVTLLTDRMSPAWRRAMGVLSGMLMIVFCVWFGIYAWDFAQVSYRLNSKSDFGNLPLWPWMGLIVVSCAGMVAAILALWRAKRLVQGQGETGV